VYVDDSRIDIDFCLFAFVVLTNRGTVVDVVNMSLVWLFIYIHIRQYNFMNLNSIGVETDFRLTADNEDAPTKDISSYSLVMSVDFICYY
jgi:hypothetical protein